MNNYHTHTYLCKHATGDVYDYVNEALKHNYKILGISDHGPLEGEGFPRMSYDEFINIYLKQINDCKEKYKDRIQIYSGVEIEYLTDKLDYLKELKSHLDYMILGPHYYSKKSCAREFSTYRCDTKEKLEEYADMICEALDTKLFKILAHPDLFATAYHQVDSNFISCSKRIIEAAMRNDVLIEYNTNGLRNPKHLGYPSPDFFKIVKEMGAKVIVGSDCHQPEELYDLYFKQAFDSAYEMGLNIVSHIKFE